MKNYKKITQVFSGKGIMKWILLISMTAYSSAWFYSTHSMKNSIMNYIEQHNKQNGYLNLKYDSISISGYPFQTNVHINNLKAEVDSSYAGSFAASIMETEDNTFPKFAHTANFSAISQAVVISKYIFQNGFSIIMPNEIISEHILEGEGPINLMHRFKTRPNIIVSPKKQIAFKALLKKARWLGIKHDASIMIPSYDVYDLSNYSIISTSKGKSLLLQSKEAAEKGITYKIDYNDNGTTYNHQVANALKPILNTLYFKHLKVNAPLLYEELSNISSYLKSGENSFNFNLNCTIRPDLYDEDNSVEFDIDLEKFEHRNAYGSFSGNSLIKGILDLKQNKIKLDKQAYLALTLNDNWHQKWSENIVQAFSHINTKDETWHKKIKMFLPQVQNYQYSTINYKMKYEGNASLNLAQNIKYIALDYFKLQTDQFSLHIKKGPEYGDDLKKLPLNFVVFLHNHQKLLQIGWEYLGVFLNSKPQDIISYATVHNDLQTLLESLTPPHNMQKTNWNGNAKYQKGLWHFGEYNASSIQSSLLSIILKHKALKK